MSVIYFHSIDGDFLKREDVISESYVPGMKTRAYIQIMSENITRQALAPFTDTGSSYHHRLMSLMDTIEDCYPKQRLIENARNQAHFDIFWKSFLRGMGNDGGYFSIEGERLWSNCLVANTMLAAGSDVMKLLILMDMGCENHAYILGEDRNYIAGIIDKGLEDYILGDNEQSIGLWKNASKHLKQTDKSPVVLSYSVCDSFPNPHIAEWENDEISKDGDNEDDGYYGTYYDLPAQTQWDLAFSKLVSNKDRHIAISQKSMNDYFDVNWNAFRLRNYLFEKARLTEKW